MTKKRYLIVLALVFVQAAFAQTKKSMTLSIRNTSAWPVNNKVLAIPWHQIKKQWPLIDTINMIVTKGPRQQVGFQLENGGSGAILNLLVQVSVPARSTIRLLVKEGRKKSFPPMVYGRLVPERYDDFAWENDKIAYRMYGRALEATTFNAYGIDIWAKRTPKMVIDSWYKGEDYHNDRGEGLDFYGVGYTLGAGNNAPYLHDSLYHARNFTRAEILDTGPLRLTFRLYYEPWLVDGRPVQKSMTISLDAGAQLNRVETQFFHQGGKLTVAAGVNQKAGADRQWLNQLENMIGYWLPKDSTNGTMGVGLVFVEPVKLKESKGHLLAIINLSEKQPFIYYAGGVWDKAGVITTADAWFAYLHKFRQLLHHPLQVKVY